MTTLETKGQLHKDLRASSHCTFSDPMLRTVPSLHRQQILHHDLPPRYHLKIEACQRRRPRAQSPQHWHYPRNSFMRVIRSLMPPGSASQCYTCTTFLGSYYPQETANFDGGSPVGSAPLWLVPAPWTHNWMMLDVISTVDDERCLAFLRVCC